MDCQASVPRDVLPPTPPGPEGSNGNGLLRVQWVAGVWLFDLDNDQRMSNLAGELRTIPRSVHWTQFAAFFAVLPVFRRYPVLNWTFNACLEGEHMTMV